MDQASSSNQPETSGDVTAAKVTFLESCHSTITRNEEEVEQIELDKGESPVLLENPASSESLDSENVRVTKKSTSRPMAKVQLQMLQPQLNQEQQQQLQLQQQEENKRLMHDEDQLQEGFNQWKKQCLMEAKEQEERVKQNIGLLKTLDAEWANGELKGFTDAQLVYRLRHKKNKLRREQKQLEQLQLQQQQQQQQQKGLEERQKQHLAKQKESEVQHAEQLGQIPSE